MNKYLVIIPVYNEENALQAITKEIKNTTTIVDILVVDDGSTDDTFEVIKSMENIAYIRHINNKGYGKTLIDGFRFAIRKGYDSVITIDSDKQHQPREINLFIQANNTIDADIISGSRYLNVSHKKIASAPPDRLKINRKITEQINKMTGFQLTDAFCGFKLYKVSALNKLNLTEYGYGMPLQLWIQAWKQKLTVREVPVALIYFDQKPYQTSSWSNMFSRYKYYLQTIQKEIKSYDAFIHRIPQNTNS